MVVVAVAVAGVVGVGVDGGGGGGVVVEARPPSGAVALVNIPRLGIQTQEEEGREGGEVWGTKYRPHFQYHHY